jgi:hypothetical protein
MKRQSLIALVVLSFLTGGIGWAADSANPQTDASDKNMDVNQPNSVPGAMQKTEDAGNRAMNSVDKGVHKGVRKTKRAGHKASQKTKAAGDKMMEPAKEPAPGY